MASGPLADTSAVFRKGFSKMISDMSVGACLGANAVFWCESPSGIDFKVLQL